MKRWLPIGAAAWLVVAASLAVAEEPKNMSAGYHHFTSTIAVALGAEA